MGKIVRTNAPSANFALISNALLRDQSLSLRARGLAAWMLSHSNGWETSVASIVAQAGSKDRRGESRDGIAAALRELEEAGYLRRVQTRSEGGVLGNADYEIQCTPFAGPSTSAPLTAEPSTAEPDPVNPAHKKINSKKTKSKKTNPPGGAAAAPRRAPELERVIEQARAMVKADVEDRVQERSCRVAEDASTDLTLFGPESPAAAPAPAVQAIDAAKIVAAYVDAHRAQHGADPLGQDIRKVAGTAKRLLADKAVQPERLLAAATSLGHTTWTDLAAQYRRGTTGGSVPASTTRPSAGALSRANNDAWDRLFEQDPGRFSIPDMSDPDPSDNRPAF